MEGTTFGTYQIHSLLRRGALGEVWRARDSTTDRDVALELLPPELTNDAKFVRRFRHEARIVMALHNPNVMPVHRYGELNGRLYLDMELIEGRELAAVLAGGPIDPVRAVSLTAQVAEGLQAAHAAGLIHGDVNASNIWLDDRDNAYVLDFGLAAPDDATDVQSDVRSLACVLEECLAGAGVDATADAMPEPLRDVIAKGRAEDPADRHATVIDFAQEAQTALAAAGLAAPADSVEDAVPWPDDPPPSRVVSGPPRRRWSRQKKLLVAGLASLGILGMVGTTLAAILMPFLLDTDGDASRSAGPTPLNTTAPAVYIAPLAVRPVAQALVPQPGRCGPGAAAPPPANAPAQEPISACDVEGKVDYQLEPVAVTLTLTAANAVKLPLSEFSAVQLVMDAASSARFGEFTATQIGKQIAFVRDGVVLAAPTIGQPLSGESLQLSGEMSAETAETIAEMLRSGS